MFGTAHAGLFHIRERAHSCAHAAVGVLSNCGDNLRNLGQLDGYFCLFLRRFLLFNADFFRSVVSLRKKGRLPQRRLGLT